jgi:hypothetical protein
MSSGDTIHNSKPPVRREISIVSLDLARSPTGGNGGSPSPAAIGKVRSAWGESRFHAAVTPARPWESRSRTCCLIDFLRLALFFGFFEVFDEADRRLRLSSGSRTG